MEDIVLALITAESDAELNAALLRATPYNDSDVMRDAIVEAKERQERRRRIAMLTGMDGGINGSWLWPRSAPSTARSARSKAAATLQVYIQDACVCP